MLNRESMPSIAEEGVFSNNRSDIPISFKERSALPFKEKLAGSAIGRDPCSYKITKREERVNGIRVMTQNILVVVIGESIEPNRGPSALAHDVGHQRVGVLNI